MTTSTFKSCILSGVLFLLATPLAHAGVMAQDFSNPTYKGHRLDWCNTWATDCGKTVADRFCHVKGFDKAGTFSKAEDVGESTRLIGSNQVCDEAMCDSFTTIQCLKTTAAPTPDDADEDPNEGTEQVIFKAPMFKGRRLDWCRGFATDCGKPAADAYCEMKGYDEAAEFVMAADIGKTRIISTGQKCNDSTCDGFKSIICQ